MRWYVLNAKDFTQFTTRNGMQVWREGNQLFLTTTHETDHDLWVMSKILTVVVFVILQLLYENDSIECYFVA